MARLVVCSRLRQARRARNKKIEVLLKLLRRGTTTTPRALSFRQNMEDLSNVALECHSQVEKNLIWYTGLQVHLISANDHCGIPLIVSC
jgi:hypothetical protein